MRLLLTADTVGGVWTFAFELAGELLTLGHSVLLVSFGGAPSQTQLDDTASLSRRGGFQYYASEIPLEWQPHNRDVYIAGARLLPRLHEEFQPDALVLSQFCYGALPVHVPKVLIAHSDVLSWAEAVGKAPLACDEWLGTYSQLVQAGVDGADAIVTPTVSMLSDFKRHFRVSGSTYIIYNGRTVCLPSAMPERQLRAVTAGRMWDPAKNLTLLLETRLPLPLLVAGQGEQVSEPNGNISLLGQLTPDAILALLSESAIYVCCSSYEPFGLAPLEAALCGCALVVNDIPSLREVWGDGALYFHDAESLASLLRLLVVDGDLLAAAQERSFARAQRYTAAAMAQQYLQVIDALRADRHEGVLAA